jgi:hypothetical protein
VKDTAIQWCDSTIRTEAPPPRKTRPKPYDPDLDPVEIDTDEVEAPDKGTTDAGDETEFDLDQADDDAPAPRSRGGWVS